MSPSLINADLQSFDLSGVVAMVTGASSGIGLHFAGVLARAGASVALAARRKEKVDEAAAELCGQGHRAIGVALDVGKPETHAAAFASVAAGLGGLPQVLVNNAGIIVSKPFLEQTEEEVASVFATNLFGAFLVAQRAARAMVEAGRGSIINVASTAGLRPGGTLASYGASKAGLLHLTRVMALELAGKGVRVNALCPGNIETDMHQVFVDRGYADSLVKRIPQRRFGRADDLSGAMLLLASDAGRYMTGSIIAVDGGQLVSSL
ncbi:MAG: SDR family oxidoreductase [Betaproteobacteria bacterium]|nr:SDR family oxidoreductase [Betaproteobacteria bacterium]MCC7216852.1 SDR family oxidoreductase [Burkholderiales bacterium]